MITWRFQKPRQIKAGNVTKFYGVGDCLSTDTKPTDGICNGSALMEMDTSKSFRFNEDSGEWVEVENSGGGSGGGGDVDEMTYEETMEVLNGGS